MAPIVGAFNPLFTLLIGSVFLNQMLSQSELLAFAVLIAGALILTLNLIIQHFRFNKQFSLMILAGLFFAISYILLAQVFYLSNFVTGLTIRSLAGATTVLSFLLFPKIRAQIFSARIEKHHFANKTSGFLILGQIMGGLSGLLLSYGVSLASPALVNSLFGVQYLTILAAAVFLAKNHPQLLEENLHKWALVQKIIGAGVLSWGVYLLSK